MQRGADLVYICRTEGGQRQARNGPSCQSELEWGKLSVSNPQLESAVGISICICHMCIYAQSCCVCLVGPWTQVRVCICLWAPSRLSCYLAYQFCLSVVKYVPGQVRLCRNEMCFREFWDRPKGLDALVAEALMKDKLKACPLGAYPNVRTLTGLSRHCSSFMPDVSYLPCRVSM